MVAAARYINSSELTTVVAEGIFLWAKVQNAPASQVRGSLMEKDWKDFEESWPEWVDLVKKEQFALFDKVNNAR